MKSKILDLTRAAWDLSSPSATAKHFRGQHKLPDMAAKQVTLYSKAVPRIESHDGTTTRNTGSVKPGIPGSLV